MNFKNFSMKRCLMSFFGIAITSASIALFKTASLGTDPFTTLGLGIINATGLHYSIVYTLENAILLAAVFFLDRHFIGIATFINLAIAGVITEACFNLLQRLLPAPGIAVRIVLLLSGIVIQCFAASLYYTADLGVSSYDAVALTAAEKTKFPFRACRITSDLLCTALGFAMGAVVGVGTVITAFFMGPLIEVFNKTVSRPLLYGKNADKGAAAESTK